MNFMHCLASGRAVYSGFIERKCAKSSALTLFIRESPAYIYITHNNIPRVTATAALFICILCSSAISR